MAEIDAAAVRSRIKDALVLWVNQPDDEEIGELLGGALAMLGGTTDDSREIAAAARLIRASPAVDRD